MDFQELLADEKNKRDHTANLYRIQIMIQPTDCICLEDGRTFILYAPPVISLPSDSTSFFRTRELLMSVQMPQSRLQKKEASTLFRNKLKVIFNLCYILSCLYPKLCDGSKLNVQ